MNEYFSLIAGSVTGFLGFVAMVIVIKQKESRRRSRKAQNDFDFPVETSRDVHGTELIGHR
jgi:hypothetical protein